MIAVSSQALATGLWKWKTQWNKLAVSSCSYPTLSPFCCKWSKTRSRKGLGTRLQDTCITG